MGKPRKTGRFLQKPGFSTAIFVFCSVGGTSRLKFDSRKSEIESFLSCAETKKQHVCRTLLSKEC